jgi:prolyl-tRNA synthetase
MSDSTLRSTGTELAAKLTDAGFDVLLDDREDRAGVKFKDADLVGIPYRVNVGKKVSEGKVELVRRSTRESVDASIAEIPAKLQEISKAGA